MSSLCYCILSTTAVRWNKIQKYQQSLNAVVLQSSLHPYTTKLFFLLCFQFLHVVRWHHYIELSVKVLGHPGHLKTGPVLVSPVSLPEPFFFTLYSTAC